MPEPSAVTSPESTLFGLKVGSLVAGFAGGVVSLSFLKGLSHQQAVLAVFTGVASAAYLTPLAMHYVLPGQIDTPIEKGTAFLIGLTAMNIIPGFLKLSEIFKRDPRSFIGGGNGGEK